MQGGLYMDVAQDSYDAGLDPGYRDTSQLGRLGRFDLSKTSPGSQPNWLVGAAALVVLALLVIRWRGGEHR